MIFGGIRAYFSNKLWIGQSISHKQWAALVRDPPTVALAESQCKMHSTQWARPTRRTQCEHALEFIVEKDRAKISFQFLCHDLRDYFEGLIQIHCGITNAINCLLYTS